MPELYTLRAEGWFLERLFCIWLGTFPGWLKYVSQVSQRD